MAPVATVIVYGLAEPRKVLGTWKVEAGRLPLPSVAHDGLVVIGIAGPLVPCAVTVHETLGVKPEPLIVIGVYDTTADVGAKEIDAAARTGGKKPTWL